MFAKTIIDSDTFLDMPLSSQALYFHLSMRGDDDGFINNPRKIQKMVGASDDDLKVLIMKNFIIPFESGVVVIKHWKIHNYIRGDRKRDTNYPEEMSFLTIKENGAYTLKDYDSQMTVKCQSLDSQMSVTCPSTDSHLPDKCPHRIGEDRISQGSIGEGEECADAHAHAHETKHLHGEFKNVKLTDKELDTLYTTFGKDESDEAIDYLSEYIKRKGYKAQSHYLAIRKWVFDAVKEDRIKKAELEAREKRSQPTSNPHSTFDSDEFLAAAVNRTFGEECF